MKIIAVAGLAIVLAGCVGPSKSLNIRQTMVPADAVSETPSVPPASHVLGQATGVSCKNKLWDNPATEHVALMQLKTQAAEQGATGVAGVTYSKEGTTLTANCWEAIYATGTLYR